MMSDKRESTNIYQRLNNVRKAIGYIQKDAKVQNYKAVTHDMVTSEIRPHLIEHGIIIVPKITHSNMVATGTQTSSGTPMMRFEARYDIEFVNIDQPDDKVIVPMEGHANDTGDKAPGKAVSYATKYAVLKVLSIETGENEESRQELKPKAISKEQADELQTMLENNAVNVDRFESWLKRDLKCNSLSEVNENSYPIVLKAIQSSIKQKAEKA